MIKKKKETMVQVQFRMPTAMLEQLKQVAEEEGRTASGLVRYLIKEYVDS